MPDFNRFEGDGGLLKRRRTTPDETQKTDTKVMTSFDFTKDFDMKRIIDVETDKDTVKMSEDEINRVMLLDRVAALANSTEDEDERNLLDRLCGWLHRVEFSE